MNIISYVLLAMARSMFERKTVGEQRLRAVIPLEYISFNINLFLICSSGELKRGSLNRMYCFTCQVLTRRGLLTVFIFFRLGGHKVNSVLKWFQNYQIVFKACYSTVYLVYSPVCKFAVCICCTLFLTSWWAKQFVSFCCCIDYLACLTMFCITKFQ